MPINIYSSLKTSGSVLTAIFKSCGRRKLNLIANDMKLRPRSGLPMRPASRRQYQRPLIHWVQLHLTKHH